jgi:AcrR family transcriptional regulator
MDYGNVIRVSPAVNPKPKPTRRERAQATRQRIIVAAHVLFTERGFTGTRMADVAAAAGVAEQTVYFTFHTKAELLQNCFDRAVLGEDDPLPPPEQPFWAAMIAAPTGREAIRHFAVGNAKITGRVGQLAQVVASATHDPDAAAIWRRSEGLRRDGYRQVVEHLATAYGLREGLDPKAATDILLTVAGPGVYSALINEYGWSLEAYLDWLSRTLAEQLLG